MEQNETYFNALSATNRYDKETNKFYHDRVFGLPMGCEKDEDVERLVAKSLIKYKPLLIYAQCESCQSYQTIRIEPGCIEMDVKFPFTYSEQDALQDKRLIDATDRNTRGLITFLHPILKSDLTASGERSKREFRGIFKQDTFDLVIKHKFGTTAIDIFNGSHIAYLVNRRREFAKKQGYTWIPLYSEAINKPVLSDISTLTVSVRCQSCTNP